MNEQRAAHDPVVAELEAALAARRSGLAPSTIHEMIRRVGSVLAREEAELDPVARVSAIIPSSSRVEPAVRAAPMIEIVPVRLEDKDVLLRLSEYYAYDFSDIVDLDVDDTGRFGAAGFERHFTDSRCHPFLIRMEGRLVGFAIHEARSRLTGDAGINDVAEFFVMKRYRRLAVGACAAAALFDRFAGPWEVREVRGNAAAIAFWRKVIDGYTGGVYTELAWDDARFRGTVQRFGEVPGRPGRPG